MKFIYIFIIAILLCQYSVYAVQSSDIPCFKFNGENYSLYYSAKNNETNNYVNEYFKQNESYDCWTEIIAVHHFPNAYSPIDQARMFKEYLSGKGCPCIININEDDNTVILDFVIIADKKNPVIMEFNVFKYQKDKICGTIALQYAKRYILNNKLEAISVKKSFIKTRKKYINKVSKLIIPDLIEASIDKGEYIKDTLVEQEIQKNNVNTPVIPNITN